MHLPPQKIILPVTNHSGRYRKQNWFKQRVQNKNTKFDAGTSDKMRYDETDCSNKLGQYHCSDNYKLVRFDQKTDNGNHYKEDTFKALHFGEKFMFFSHREEFFRNDTADQKKIDKKNHQAADECSLFAVNIKEQQNDARCIFCVFLHQE